MNINLIESFSEFKEFKNIDRATLMSVLEEVFRTMLRRKYGTDENCDIIVNTETGDLEIWRRRIIVEDGFSEDDDLEIEYAEAIKIEPDFEIGEEVAERIGLEEFGRRAVLTARQTLQAKVTDLEKEELFNSYKDRTGEIFIGEVYQIWKKEILVHDEHGNELLLPKIEQIPADFYKKGETVKAVISSVEMVNNSPKIILSRTDPRFIERMFEAEIPEVFDGLIVIKKVVRDPGERAKVAVESFDDRIDPVGACVGMKGSRIHGIVRELKNENIDVINYTSNTQLFIQRALNPAKINSIKLDDVKMHAQVYLNPDQVSLAIGKGGQNIKLACKLTGYEIDVFRDVEDDEEDVDLEEFSDEIEAWMIDEFKGIGCDTARSVLALTVEDIVKRTELEEEMAVEVLRILSSEFE